MIEFAGKTPSRLHVSLQREKSHTIEFQQQKWCAPHIVWYILYMSYQNAFPEFHGRLFRKHEKPKKPDTSVCHREYWHVIENRFHKVFFPIIRQPSSYVFANVRGKWQDQQRIKKKTKYLTIENKFNFELEGCCIIVIIDCSVALRSSNIYNFFLYVLEWGGAADDLEQQKSKQMNNTLPEAIPCCW